MIILEKVAKLRILSLNNVMDNIHLTVHVYEVSFRGFENCEKLETPTD